MDKSVCVDLEPLWLIDHGVLRGSLGKPRPGAKEFLINIRKFAKVIIFIARLAEKHESNKKTFDQIQSWLKYHDLPYDEIYVTKGRPITEVYADDRAISVPKNPVESDFDEALTRMRRFTEDI